MMTTQAPYKGTIAIIGKPNVGKSTLLNQLLGEKLSITADKPQTTRHAVFGQQMADGQVITYVDTPGLQYQYHNHLTKQMNQMAKHYMQTADVILWLVNAAKQDEADQAILELCKQQTTPVIFLMNKIDKIPNKKELLPRMQAWANAFNFAAIVPISAKKKLNLEQLQALLKPYLSAVGSYDNPLPLYTDKNQQLSEIIREKIFRFTGHEVPYSSTVVLEKVELIDDTYHIKACIQVLHTHHKKIMIGCQGSKLKQIGTQARLSLERILEKQVYLKLWVEIKPDWMEHTTLWQMARLTFKD